jgi:hypothetical protein
VEYKNPKTLQAAIELAQSYYQSHSTEMQVNYTQPIKWCQNHLSNTHSTEECRMKNYSQPNLNKRKYNSAQGFYKHKNNQNQSFLNQQTSRSYNDKKSYPRQSIDHSYNKNQQNNEKQLKNKTHSNIKSTYTVETSNSNNQTNQLEQAIVEIEISSLSSPDDSNLLKTTAFINDIEVPIIIDTGAGQSIIPSFLIEKHKIKTHNSNITCKFGNNSKQHNVPITDPLDVVVFDTSVNLEFLVLPRTNVLLGIDWLNLTEAIVCPYNEKLIFKQRQVFLEGNRRRRL